MLCKVVTILPLLPSCVLQVYGLTLSAAPPLRRGSTPLPIKHLLTREEAVSEDYDWIPGLDEPSALAIGGCSDAQDAPLLLKVPEQKYRGPLRIVLLGQNGVGKSSLALSLAGLSDRSLSVDSETLASGKDVLLVLLYCLSQSRALFRGKVNHNYISRTP